MTGVKLDWKAYYKDFSRYHGGEPILYQQDKETGRGGYLLFPDGWMYSRSSPSGPEYPPSDDADALVKIRDYWTNRLQVTRRQFLMARDQLRELVQLQQSKSAPIKKMVSLRHEDDDGNQRNRTESVDVNFADELKDLRLLWQDYRRCRKMLEDIRVPEPMRDTFSPAGIITEMEEIERDK